MARDSSGTKNQPHYSALGAPSDAADLTEVSDFAAGVGNRKADTASVRAALAGADVWTGLEFFETDTDLTWLRGSSGWRSASPKRKRFIAGTASGTLSGSTWLNLAAQQAIPANPFGNAPYTIRVYGASIATLASGNAYAIRVLVDGATPTIGGQAQVAGTGQMSVEVEAQHSIATAGASAGHTIDVQILAVTGTATVVTGSSVSFIIIELERSDTF